MPVQRLTTAAISSSSTSSFSRRRFILFFAQVLLFQCQFSFQPRQFSIPQFGHPIEVVGPLGLLDLQFDFLNRFARLAEPGDGCFFRLPSGLQGLQVALLFVQLRFENGQPSGARGDLFPFLAPLAQFPVGAPCGRLHPAQPACFRFLSAAAPPLHRPNRWLYPAEIDPKYIDATVSPRPPVRCP